MFETIPAAWRRVPLSSLGQRVRRRNTTGNTNVLTISAVHGLVNQKEFFNKIVASENLSNYFLLKSGEFAYNKSYSNGYPVGVVRRLKRYQSGILSPLYICFDMSSSEVDERYAELFFDSQWFIDEINQIAKEGARNHGLLNVGVGEFFDLEFVLPPLPEQQKIAAILSSVDDVIAKTRAQIDKLKDLKTGMMQELLTKGIGHTEFKDSPVGRIPVSWNVTRLGDVTQKFQNGYAFKASGYVDEGIPIISMASIGLDGNFNAGYSKTKHWDAGELRALERYIVQDGDLLIAMTDVTPTMELIGRCCIAQISQPHLLNQRVGLIRLDSSRVNKHFVAYYSNHEIWRDYARGMSGLGAQANLGTPQIANGIIPLPPLEEQEQIASILQSIDKIIKAKEEKASKGQAAKKALMQDLLTGKVRVKVDQKESAVA